MTAWCSTFAGGDRATGAARPGLRRLIHAARAISRWQRVITGHVRLQKYALRVLES